MKSSILAFTIAVAFCRYSTADAASQTATLDVSGMSCVTCPLTVKAALNKVPGVRRVAVDFKTRQAVVTFENTRTNVESLQKATANVGFPSTLRK